MKFKKLIKGAFQKQLLKGVAVKSSMDDLVYKEHFKILNKAIETGKINYKGYLVLKGVLVEGKKVKEPNKYTEELIAYLPVMFSRRKQLLPQDIIFIEKKFIPYLKSCQKVFRGKELDTIKPLMDKVNVT